MACMCQRRGFSRGSMEIRPEAEFYDTESNSERIFTWFTFGYRSAVNGDSNTKRCGLMCAVWMDRIVMCACPQADMTKSLWEWTVGMLWLMHENLGRGKKIPSKTIQKDYGHFMLFCTVRENSKMATRGATAFTEAVPSKLHCCDLSTPKGCKWAS